VASLRMLCQNHDCVTVVESAENVGYFRGLNIGLRTLRRERPDIDWVIAGNNDLEFPADICDTIARIADPLQSHCVISPNIVTLDGQHQNPHVIERISTFREVIYDLYYSNYYIGLLIYKLAKMFPRVSERSDEKQWQTARPIYQGHGSCYLLTPKFFTHFSELWAPTFMMSEELFLSKQLADVGEHVFYEPIIQVTHHWHGSLQNVPNRNRWEMARNAHQVYRKYVKVFHRD
jgi:GT2 family glycosyltransferase